jgi:hypothetical protein
MPSDVYRKWATARARALDEMAQAHTAVGGTGPGRRHATQQVNQSYAVLLAAQFQGFCRDLHSECVDALVGAIAPAAVQDMVEIALLVGRQLDRGNAHPGSLGADFGRFDLIFWSEVESYNPRNPARKDLLEMLNRWRNAIVHQVFDPNQLGGTTVLRLEQVRRWRAACKGLARSFDEVMRRHLQTRTGASPW